MEMELGSGDRYPEGRKEDEGRKKGKEEGKKATYNNDGRDKDEKG
jgi:hypothetical protein